MERDRRIELLTLAWKAKVIPFYESRIIHWCDWPESNWHPTKRTDFKSVAATDYATVALLLVPRVRLELTKFGF